MNRTLQHASWTLLGEWTWDAMTAIDVCTAFRLTAVLFTLIPSANWQ